MNALPSLFLSHGSPMLALDAGKTGTVWQALAQRLPKPRAILMLSAHWLTRTPQVSAAIEPETIHDFGGFPEALYHIDYPAPGAPWLAEEVAGLLEKAGIAASVNPQHGLDHGAWVPLRNMYPDASVPVVQLSLQAQLGPEHHYRLGEALSPLREQGILLVGSGSLTHNLYDVQWNAGDDESAVPAYVTDFQHWMHVKLMENDRVALFNYRNLAPHATRAHPTDEHLLPLFAMLGAASTGPIERVFAGITEGVLAMDIYRFG